MKNQGICLDCGANEGDDHTPGCSALAVAVAQREGAKPDKSVVSALDDLHRAAGAVATWLNHWDVPFADEDEWTGATGDRQVFFDAINCAAKVLTAVALGVPAEGQPSYDVKLEARPAKGGDWTEIYPAQLNWVVKEGHEVRATETVRSSPAASAETTTCKHCGEVMSYHPAPTSEMAVEMRVLADEFDGEAKAHGAMGDKDEKVKCLRAAYALRSLADCQSPAVTDAMCEAALDADASDRIQGFSYSKRHVIRDVWANKEIWSAPVGSPEDHQAFQRQCQIERMRRALEAALSCPSQPVNATVLEVASHMTRLLYNDATLGDASPEQKRVWIEAAKALTTIFSITRKTTEEPRG